MGNVVFVFYQQQEEMQVIEWLLKVATAYH